MNEGNRLAYGAVVGCVLVLAALLLMMPSFFLATGVQALGATAGWWTGDPNTNDGEETWATAIGAVTSIGILGIAAVALLALRRPFGVASRIPALAGVGVLAIAYVVVWVRLMTAPAGLD